jgi:3-oxoacyl-[acyl-carrier-protein] synthase II
MVWRLRRSGQPAVLMPKHRVAITGIGMVTALGSDAVTSWRRLVAGDNGIRTITYFDPSQYTCTVAGEARDVPFTADLGSLRPEYYRRGAKLFLNVAREAYTDAGLANADVPSSRIGVAVGTSVNYLHMRLCRHYFQFRRRDLPYIDLDRFEREGTQPYEIFYRRQGDFVGAATAKALGLGGPNIVVDTACAASSFAIAEAFRLIASGRVDAMLAGGSCAIVTPLAILAFAILGALSGNRNPDEASRPFDRNRDGFVMGEGAGAVILERYDLAVKRNATIYGELAGYGTTMNALALTDPSRDGEAEAHAMRLALQEARMTPADVDYVAAHGTSTPKNDAIESAAISQVFGSHADRLMVSSNKGQIGHTISAAGVCNLICATKALEEGVVPPTAHYQEPDPECGLDYVPNVGRKASVRAALVNAFAFGGQNMVLAVKAAT